MNGVCLESVFTYICILTVDVTWDAKLPAFFGNVTYLQCKISDTSFSCNKSLRQWYGGPNYGSLCYEDKCTASNKYEVMKQSRCQYTLMIHDFSDRDVNCEYTCLYGISKMRRNLTLDEKKFIYEPHVEDIQEESTENGKTLNWKINISKIFPTPSCGADLEGESITDHLQISVTKPGFYYAAALQINLPSSSCGKADVYCFLGDYKVNITTKNFDSCHLQGSENSNKNNTMMMGLITSAIILVIAVLIGCVYRKKELCFKRLLVRAKN
ncbi:unnamed protein product [Mytilus coruscus]|uniref:Uncharacterized protein n=1 Tax=Mytilus coruscus TaxID=42192 RepID=A0A6J8C1V1_MYTCO|nr:unnamed protein product [Mytilus coruscus]